MSKRRLLYSTVLSKWLAACCSCVDVQQQQQRQHLSSSDLILPRVGRWKDAVTANIRAYEADMAYTDHCMVAYGPEHNTDMLIYAATMAGMVQLSSLPHPSVRRQD